MSKKLTDKKIHEWKFEVTPARKEVVIPVSLVEQRVEGEKKKTEYVFQATVTHDGIERTLSHGSINELHRIVKNALDAIYKVEWSTFIKLRFSGERDGRPLGSWRDRTPWNPGFSQAPVKVDMMIDHEVVEVAEYLGKLYVCELGNRRYANLLDRETFEGIKGGVGSWREETTVFIPYSDEMLERVQVLIRRMETLAGDLHDLLKPGSTENTLTLELWSQLNLSKSHE